MTEFLSFSDFELEFLNELGIFLCLNNFHNNNTGNYYYCTGANNGTVKEFDATDSYFICEFKGKDGSILFVRNREHNEPTIIVRFKDVTLMAREDYKENLFPNVDVNVNDLIESIYISSKNISICARKGKIRAVMEISPSNTNEPNCTRIRVLTRDNCILNQSFVFRIKWCRI